MRFPEPIHSIIIGFAIFGMGCIAGAMAYMSAVTIVTAKDATIACPVYNSWGASSPMATLLFVGFVIFAVGYSIGDKPK